jgi:hypothetical protein
MKNLSTLLLLAGIISWNVTFAQKNDSTQTKKDSSKKSDYFSKYKTKTAANNTTPQVNSSLSKKQDPKKVESSYKTENGRITGGETKLKLGKKN